MANPNSPVSRVVAHVSKHRNTDRAVQRHALWWIHGCANVFHWLVSFASPVVFYAGYRSCKSQIACPTTPRNRGDPKTMSRHSVWWWSFVCCKAHQQWIWLALGTATRLIVGCFVGARDEAGAQGLWQSRPPVYRQCAVYHTDCWRAYAAILPLGLKHGTKAAVRRVGWNSSTTPSINDVVV
ncbi:MAG: IS1 family transposase [Chloroflexota bacterium]